MDYRKDYADIYELEKNNLLNMYQEKLWGNPVDFDIQRGMSNFVAIH